MTSSAAGTPRRSAMRFAAARSPDPNTVQFRRCRSRARARPRGAPIGILVAGEAGDALVAAAARAAASVRPELYLGRAAMLGLKERPG